MIAATEQQMSANLTVSNRQRSVQVDLKKVEKMAERLRVAVFDQLIADTPDHLDEEILDDMAERGVFSLVLVSDRQIRALNNDWMGKDKPTDVLSFPLSLDPPPSPEVPWEVGEIVISLKFRLASMGIRSIASWRFCSCMACCTFWDLTTWSRRTKRICSAGRNIY
jgi:ssRNA-specific RNase YbeY (16S rRNA maturation enzyme)